MTARPVLAPLHRQPPPPLGAGALGGALCAECSEPGRKREEAAFAGRVSGPKGQRTSETCPASKPSGREEGVRARARCATAAEVSGSHLGERGVQEPPECAHLLPSSFSSSASNPTDTFSFHLALTLASPFSRPLTPPSLQDALLFSRHRARLCRLPRCCRAGSDRPLRRGRARQAGRVRLRREGRAPGRGW